MDRVIGDEGWTCPDCGATRREVAKTCPSCGAIIAAAASASASVATEPPQRAASPPNIARDTPSRLYLGIALCVALLLLAIVAASTFGRNSVASSTICRTADGQRVADLLQADAQRWDDANRLAGSATSRGTLAPQVTQLRLIRRDIQARQYPPCGQQAQTLLIEMMDHTISAYTTYLQQESDLLVTTSLNLAREKQDAFNAALRDLNGLPALSPAATTEP